MFSLDVKPTFVAIVKIPVAGGAARPVRVRYNYKTREEYAALWAAYADKPVAELLGELIAGWDGEDGPQGAWEGIGFPLTPESLAALANTFPRAPRAFLDAYAAEVFGVAEKN